MLTLPKWESRHNDGALNSDSSPPADLKARWGWRFIQSCVFVGISALCVNENTAAMLWSFPCLAQMRNAWGRCYYSWGFLFLE